MEEVLLPGVVPLPEHDVVPVGSVNIQVYLSDVRTVQPRYFPYQKMSVFSSNYDDSFLTSSPGTSPLVPALFCQYSTEYATEFLATSQEHPLRRRYVIKKKILS